MSLMKTSVFMCSRLWFRTPPTTTTGWVGTPRASSPLYVTLSQVPARHWVTMESATIRESVSFQRPLRSVCVPGSVRVTVVPPHPATRSTSTAAITSFFKVILLSFEAREVDSPPEDNIEVTRVTADPRYKRHGKGFEDGDAGIISFGHGD